MRIPGFLCVGNVEVINAVRTQAYFNRKVVPWDGSECGCPALDDGFTDPASDDAPWYDSAHAESAEFGGLKTDFIDLSSPVSRSSTPRLDEGSEIGEEQLSGRIIEVSGFMFASSQRGMWWGEKWLRSALRGANCTGGCTGDQVHILPFCRDTGGPQSDYDGDFRTLFDCALVSGPTFDKITDDVRTYEGQAVHFQLQSQRPWLFGQPALPANANVVFPTTTGCVRVTAEQWSQGEALAISVGAGTDGISGATVDLTFSLDGGTCPEDRVHSSITYEIGALPPNSYVTIDAARRQVRYHNPTAKRDESGWDRIAWSGRFCWPVVPRCTSMCVCCTNNDASGDAIWTVESRTREL